VLHLEPYKIVVLGPFAIVGDIELRLREAKDLLAFEQLLLGSVVQLRSRRLLRETRDVQNDEPPRK
jgi:hypothetical protein